MEDMLLLLNRLVLIKNIQDANSEEQEENRIYKMF
jgi:hypothetical protein